MRTAIDTNLLSTVLSGDPVASRIAEQLGVAHQEGGLVVAAPVYAELRAHPRATKEYIDQYLETTNIVIDFDLNADLWRLVADRFAAYAKRRRQSGGDTPKRVLADFLIGAHALRHAARLFTLDVERYKIDFPELTLTSL